jgi:hypothetical protein
MWAPSLNVHILYKHSRAEANVLLGVGQHLNYV